MTFKQTVEDIAKRTHSLKILRFFKDVDLRCSHEGLTIVAKKHHVDPTKLAPGEFLVFANSAQNKLKIYAPGNVLCYVRSPGYGRIDMNIVRLIPRFFNGTEFRYDAAAREMLKTKLKLVA